MDTSSTQEVSGNQAGIGPPRGGCTLKAAAKNAANTIPNGRPSTKNRRIAPGLVALRLQNAEVMRQGDEVCQEQRGFRRPVDDVMGISFPQGGTPAGSRASRASTT